jgi:hypothetical protein
VDKEPSVKQASTRHSGYKPIYYPDRKAGCLEEYGLEIWVSP